MNFMKEMLGSMIQPKLEVDDVNVNMLLFQRVRLSVLWGKFNVRRQKFTEPLTGPNVLAKAALKR